VKVEVVKIPNLVAFVALDLGFQYGQRSRSCAQNSFVGSVPRHPILATYLQAQAMKNIQGSYYGKVPLIETGPCGEFICVLIVYYLG